MFNLEERSPNFGKLFEMTADSKTSFLNVPNEIIEMIFTDLNLDDRSRLRVNRRLSCIERGIAVKEKEQKCIKFAAIWITDSKFFVKEKYGERNLLENFPLDSFDRYTTQFKFGCLRFMIDFEHPNLPEYVEKLKHIPAERLIVENRKADSSLSEREITDNDIATIDMIRSTLNSHGNLAIRSCCAPASMDELIRQREIVRHSASTRSLSMSVSKETADTYVYQLHGHQKPFDSSIIRHGTDADISLYNILRHWNDITQFEDDVIMRLWHTNGKYFIQFAPKCKAA